MQHDDPSAPTPVLAADFPPADPAVWRGLVERALKGASAERLARRTRDGIEIRTLYTRAEAGPLGAAAGLPGAAPFVRGARAATAAASGGWDIRQRIAHPDPATANRLALADLEGGATSLTLRIDEAATCAGAAAPDGVVLLDLDDLDRALGGVLLDLAPVALDAGGRSAEAGALLLALFERRGHAPGSVRAELGADPLGAALRGSDLEPEGALARAATLAHLAADRWPGVATLRADGRPWHAAGASEAQELAAVLATAVHYLRALEAAGLEPGTGAGQITFTLAVDADFFLGVAKLRALRRLWGRVLEASGVADAARGMVLHAETATLMGTRRDPWSNMLRATVACAAAVAGGADGATVLPFDHALGPPSPLARRVARNTQLVLVEEGNLHRVADPAGGAWYVESLTRDLAGQAWDRFRAIEAEGGMLAALRAGAPQTRVAATWAARARDLATRKEPVTGVSEFADPAERAAPPPEPFDPAPLVARTRERLAGVAPIGDPDALLAAARAGRILAPLPPVAGGIAPLPSHRLGEAFEALRDRGDLALARDGTRPRVLLLALGPLARHGARAAFARSLLAAGGIEAPTTPPLDGVEAAVAAFRDSGARIAALCSSDEVYADLAAPAARALKAGGCEHLLLMGDPGPRRDELAAAGVDRFARLGEDVVEILAGLHDRLGTPGIPGPG